MRPPTAVRSPPIHRRAALVLPSTTRIAILRGASRRGITVRTPLVAGNWKIHGTRESARALARAVADGVPTGVDIALFPPFPFIQELVELVAGRVAFGVQDVSANAQGAYTGEVAASMAVEYGARYTLVGHSERRQYHGEDDARVAAKFVAAQAGGLVPVLCIGETLVERQADATETVVARQLGAVIDAAGIAAFAHAVVAYEPVWAIGTGQTATAEQAQAVHAFIRGKVAEADARIASSLRLLYGGSCKPVNAVELFAQPDIDGGLIGGASLIAHDFLAIAQAASAAATSRK
jgi:triosephosphate isomerase